MTGKYITKLGVLNIDQYPLSIKIHS